MHQWAIRAAIGAALVLASAAPLRSQQASIDGRVQSADGDAIAGALIRIVESRQSAHSDSAGRFRLTVLSAGRSTLTVSAIGWRPVSRVLEIPASGAMPLTLVLDAAPLVLSEVVVSASRETQSKRETALSVGTVDGQTIARIRPHHPGDIMGQVAGAWVTNLGGESHFTSIRQPITTKPVYAFLEDGVPIRSTGFFNHNGLYEINLPQAERVEVIKGPGTALYGSDAVGGVVNVLTRQPTERPAGSMFVEGGRFGYARGLATLSGTRGKDGFRADLNLTRSDGWRDGAPYQRQSLTLRWDHAFGGRDHLKSVVAFSHIDQPADGGSDLSRIDFDADPAINYTPITFRRVTALRAQSVWERRSDLALWTTTLFGRYNTLDLMPSWQLSFDPQIWESRHASIGALTRYRRTVPSLRTSLSAGADLEYSPGSRMEQGITPVRTGDIYREYQAGPVQYDYDVAFWQASPYVQADLAPLDRLRVSLGLRADLAGYSYDNLLGELTTGTHRRPASTDVSFRRLSPKLGMALDLTDQLNVFASYRAAFRAPSESQLFRQGAALSTVDLAPVKADNYEVGIRTGIGRTVNLEATVYQLDVADDILTFQDPASGLRITSNAGATRHRGIELGGSVVPVPEIRIDGTWVHATHRYQSWRPNPSTDFGGNEIELAPRNLGRAAITFTPAFGAALTAEWIHHGSYWQDPANTARYHGHDLANLLLNVPVSRRFELSGRVTNLTGVRYAESSSVAAFQGERLRPGQPRTFFVGLQYKGGGE